MGLHLNNKGLNNLKGENYMKNEQEKSQSLEEEQRREFLGKFGRLAATVPVGMLVLMGPTQSRAQTSDDGSDIGNPGPGQP